MVLLSKSALNQWYLHLFSHPYTFHGIGTYISYIIYQQKTYLSRFINSHFNSLTFGGRTQCTFANTYSRMNHSGTIFHFIMYSLLLKCDMRSFPDTPTPGSEPTTLRSSRYKHPDHLVMYPMQCTVLYCIVWSIVFAVSVLASNVSLLQQKHMPSCFVGVFCELQRRMTERISTAAAAMNFNYMLKLGCWKAKKGRVRERYTVGICSTVVEWLTLMSMCASSSPTIKGHCPSPDTPGTFLTFKAC